ncbi:L-asparaginase [Blastococcus colisei]|uniref:L-asparaginase n=1 Tax=Blastococcus colisei TaxID=1564162 RepID=A0A543PG10_9ACTN|nr:asparaginase domain-containing protein [Blastococcus colisei]TQN43005.1 L-asparaginase [Blastococcus colisei]
MRLHVITTGGTIDVEYSLQGTMVTGPPMIGTLLQRIRTDLEVTIDSVCRKDSRDLDDDDRDLIRHRAETSDTEHVLITHGTDSMTTTAAHLQGVHGKVVVLTGAMQPARMIDSDASFNVGLAVGALQLLPAGIFIAMSGRVFPAGTTIKDCRRGLFIADDGDAP